MKLTLTLLFCWLLTISSSCQQKKRGNVKTKNPTTVVTPAAKIKPGTWEATVTNGYKGDKITFTVSADGKRVENVEFTGYWQNKSRTIEELKNLDPPNPFIITNESFSAVQQVPKSAMWWEMTGLFLHQQLLKVPIDALSLAAKTIPIN